MSEVKKEREVETVKYPKNTLKEALKLAQSIQDNNAGEPYNRLDLAQSLDTSPESSKFRTLITSSSRYGLTRGGYQAEKIELTDIGRSIVAPRTDDEKNSSLLQALRRVPSFRKVIDRFDQAKLPRDDLLKNTLERDFQIPHGEVDRFLTILKTNFNDFGLLVENKGNIRLRTDKLAETIMTSEEGGEKEEEGAIEDEEEKEPEKPSLLKPTKHRIFISHSKNKTILDQLKIILEYGQFECIIAEEVETTSIPIPDKIFGLMRQCDGAIINISADKQEMKQDGTYGVNSNVLIEIGASFFGYNKKVILLTDKRVSLPSNLQGLYRCEYEGEELSFNTYTKLQKTLTEFR